jgi:hypothetical protein
MDKKLLHGFSLGTAAWQDGYRERRALVARLHGGAGRVVDLNRIERARLAKLGEGRPDALADALVPPSLRQLLESGPLGLQRAAQALRYAEKWASGGARGATPEAKGGMPGMPGMPDAIAPPAGSYALMACLPRPLAVKACDGRPMDRLCVQGPGATLPALSGPTVAIVGGADGGAAGCCIAAESPRGPVLGAWLHVGPLPGGEMAVEAGGGRSAAPMSAWADLAPPPLLPGEVLFLPAPMLRLPVAAPGGGVVIETPFDRLEIEYGPEPVHPVIQ